MAEQIGKTVDALLKALQSDKKDTKQVIYDTILESLEENEKKHVQPYSYNNNVVILHIDSPARMYAVNLKKNQLLKKVQEKTGKEAVKDIKLRIGIIKWQKN